MDAVSTISQPGQERKRSQKC